MPAASRQSSCGRAALRHVAEAQGRAGVAWRARIPRESQYRALSPNSNPTMKTLMAVLDSCWIKARVYHAI
ncbi:DNA-binding protein [Duganella sp. FT27W]|uniref:helix-turn-helix domain-containing transcriptional regulator n=1 Tax=Duganella sp. FT27W TaxID=2654636 RepID=UPI0035A6D2CD